MPLRHDINNNTVCSIALHCFVQYWWTSFHYPFLKRNPAFILFFSNCLEVLRPFMAVAWSECIIAEVLATVFHNSPISNRMAAVYWNNVSVPPESGAPRRTVNSACKINCHRRYFQIVTNILHLPRGFERSRLLLMPFIRVFKGMYAATRYPQVLDHSGSCSTEADLRSCFLPYFGDLHPEIVLTQWEEAIVCRTLYVHGVFLHLPYQSATRSRTFTAVYLYRSCISSRNAAAFLVPDRFLARLDNSNRIYNVVNTALFLFGVAVSIFFRSKIRFHGHYQAQIPNLSFYLSGHTHRTLCRGPNVFLNKLYVTPSLLFFAGKKCNVVT